MTKIEWWLVRDKDGNEDIIKFKRSMNGKELLFYDFGSIGWSSWVLGSKFYELIRRVHESGESREILETGEKGDLVATKKKTKAEKNIGASRTKVRFKTQEHESIEDQDTPPVCVLLEDFAKFVAKEEWNHIREQLEDGETEILDPVTLNHKNFVTLWQMIGHFREINSLPNVIYDPNGNVISEEEYKHRLSKLLKQFKENNGGMMTFRIINPSDEAYLDAKTFELACIASIMVTTGHGLEQVGGDSFMPPLVNDVWFRMQFGKNFETALHEADKKELARILRSFRYANERTSTRNFVRYAHELADRLEKSENIK